MHTLRLKATLGNYAEQIAEVTDELKELNRIYTDIVMVTGPNPDVNRDYQFEKAIPDVLEDIKEQSERLKNTEKAFEELSGETGGQMPLKDFTPLWTGCIKILKPYQKDSEIL